MIRFGAGRRVRAGLAVAATVSGAAIAACSSSSGTGASAGALASDGGADSTASMGVAENFDAQFDGQTSLSLKWQVVEIPATGYGFGPPGDGGVDTEDDSGGVVIPDAGGLSPDYGDGGSRGVPGVQVCLYADAGVPCVTSDSTGTFTILGLSPRTNTVLTLTKAGYTPLIEAIQTASTDMDGTGNPIFINLTSDPPPPIGVPVDWTNKGQVTFFAIGPAPDGGNDFTGDQGAVVTLTPSSGDGPYFLTKDGYFDLGANAIVSQLGWYYNLAPGNYEITFTDTVHDCRPIEFPFAGYGFPDPPTSVQFPIVAGYTTDLVGVLCTMKPLIVEAGVQGESAH